MFIGFSLRSNLNVEYDNNWSQIVSFYFLHSFSSLFKAIQFVFVKVFDMNNVITPLKFAMKLLFGVDFAKGQNKVKSLEYLEAVWASGLSDSNLSDSSFGPRRIFGMNPALFKSLFLALFGLVAQFCLFLIKKGKSSKLDKIVKDEEEEKQRLLEEEWRSS